MPALLVQGEPEIDEVVLGQLLARLVPVEEAGAEVSQAGDLDFEEARVVLLAREQDRHLAQVLLGHTEGIKAESAAHRMLADW